MTYNNHCVLFTEFSYFFLQLTPYFFSNIVIDFRMFYLKITFCTINKYQKSFVFLRSSEVSLVKGFGFDIKVKFPDYPFFMRQRKNKRYKICGWMWVGVCGYMWVEYFKIYNATKPFTVSIVNNVNFERSLLFLK